MLSQIILHRIKHTLLCQLAPRYIALMCCGISYYSSMMQHMNVDSYVMLYNVMTIHIMLQCHVVTSHDTSCTLLLHMMQRHFPQS